MVKLISLGFDLMASGWVGGGGYLSPAGAWLWAELGKTIKTFKNTYEKISQGGNMQHPICGTETNDYFYGGTSLIARVSISSESGCILNPNSLRPVSPLFSLLQPQRSSWWKLFTFFFRFGHLIGFLIWDQLCCSCQVEESSIIFSGNIQFTLHLAGSIPSVGVRIFQVNITIH